MRILISSVVDLKRSAHNRLHEFVRHLSREHQVTILSIKDWWKSQQTDVSLYDQGFEDMWQRVDVRYFTGMRISPIVQELLSVLTIGSLLRQVGGSFDVHFNYNTLISGLLVAAKLRAARVDTVYDLADDLPAMISTSPQISPALRPLGGALAWLMVRCNLMVSKKVTLTTEALGLPRSFQDKYALLPNGVDTTLFRREDSNELRNQLGLGNDFVLGYVGVLREWIDLEPVFGALDVLRSGGYSIRLLVVGEEGGLQGPKALADRYGVSELVLFTGTVPYPKVPLYISCIDAGLVPFRINRVTAGALPLKLFEYMACEVPVICTRLPGIHRVAQDRVIYAADKDEFANAIKELYGSPSQRSRLGQQGRQFVENNCSWARIALELENLLQQVVLKDRLGSSLNTFDTERAEMNW